jgi:nucleotide-binding universal stress UspA family protein
MNDSSDTGNDFVPRVVVVATDGSEQSIHAARVAAAIARRNKAVLHFITVVRPPEGWWGVGGAPPPPEAVSEALVDAQGEVLDTTIMAVDLTGVTHEATTELGDPAGTIIAFCESKDADLLVIGRRGAGLFERFVMGSVADRLAHYSPCPLLIVP